MKELLLRRKGRFILYIFACFIPVLDQLLINGVFALLFESAERRDMEFFYKVVIILIVAVILSFVFYVVSRFLRISYMRDTLLDVREKAFDKIINSSYKSFSQKSKDVYISNLINDINTFENTFFLNLINVIFRGGLYVTSLIILALLDLTLALAIFTLSVIILFIIRLFQKKTVSLQAKTSMENENFTVGMSNTLNGLEIIKLNNLQSKFLSESLKRIDRVERTKFKFLLFSDVQMRLSSVIAYGVYVGVIIYILSRLQDGESLGKLIFMLQLSTSIIFPMTDVIPRINILKSSSSIYEKITKNQETDEAKSIKNTEFSFKERIEAVNLSFSYEDKLIINNGSFTIEKGKKYLIKGPSGAGKSTLLKILSMIYDNYEGKLTVDGVDYKTIKEEGFNKAAAFIYQEVFLFEDTLFNNISLFKNMSEEKVLQAAYKSGLKDFLEERPQGLQEHIGENGKNLSGGQRQRISIARAIAKDAEILFVDEGTSSLNEEIGREVEKSILALDSTVISISHRYYENITEMYDYVIEINDGQIITWSTTDYFSKNIY